MTKIFDDKVRKGMLASKKFFEEESSDSKPKELVVRRSSVKEARPYIAAHHYSKTMPDSTTDVFMGYYDRTFAGVCVFGMGTGKGQYYRLVDDLQDGEYRELTRMWSPDDMPKNTESRLISESIKLLPKKVRFIMSYADPSVGHMGTIYQATNWYYLGTTSAGQKMVDKDGKELHARLTSIYRARHPEYKDMTGDEIMEIYGWKYITSSSKHRYVMLRGNNKIKKKMFGKIEKYIQPYPTI